MTYNEQLQTPEWDLKRKQILKRDNYQCQFCGTDSKKLNVHHLAYFSGLKAWEYDNELLISLCDEHHELIHEMNKVISLIAFDVIKYKIDLVELESIIYLYFSDKIDFFKKIQKHYEHKIDCYLTYGFDTEYFKDTVKRLKRNLERKHGIVLDKIDTSFYKHIEPENEERNCL